MRIDDSSGTNVGLPSALTPLQLSSACEEEKKSIELFADERILMPNRDESENESSDGASLTVLC